MDNLKTGRLLLVGEGDFSFSVAFTKHISSDVLVTASSLLSYAALCRLYKDAQENVELLVSTGVEVLYTVDATKLHEHEQLSKRKFRRIIFNFPHVGGKSNIKRNRSLLHNFFASVSHILEAEGDVCMSLCNGQGGAPADNPVRLWANSWQAVALAAEHHFLLHHLWPFDASIFPEYSCTGYRSLDKLFHTEGSLTYVFRRGVASISPEQPVLKKSAQVVVEGKNYNINQVYVAERLSSDLLNTEHHPICLTWQHVQDILTSTALGSPALCLPEPSAIIQWDTQTPTDAYTITQPGSTHSEHSQCTENIHNKALRRTLLDHFDGITSILPGEASLSYLCGKVCRRKSTVDCNDPPVTHEVMVISNSGNVESFIEDTIMKLLRQCFKQGVVLEIKEANECGTWLNTYLSKKPLYRIDATYKSENTALAEPCNQVQERGDFQLESASCVKSQISSVIGYIGIKADNNRFLASVLNLDAVAMARYDITDNRILWSSESAFLEQFKDRSPCASFIFKPVSLYPPQWRHDTSFWENSDKSFNEQEMFDIIRDVAGDNLKKVVLMNVWTDRSTGRVSRCYRQLYQSSVKCVSCSEVHRIQSLVRLTVAQQMGIELR